MLDLYFKFILNDDDTYLGVEYDKRIVEYWLNENPTYEQMSEFLESIGYHDVYMGGYTSLEISWIPRGTMFYVHEYDGHETVETPNTCGMIMA